MKRKIVIEIPDVENFDWNVAFNNWKSFMQTCNCGYDTTPKYIWYDISPTTRTKPTTDENSIVERSNFKGLKLEEIKNLELEIEALTSKLARLKES